MTREETIKILAIMFATYPNFKLADKETAVEVWTMMLEEYTYTEVAQALKGFIKTDTSGFAPTISQLIQKVELIKGADEELNELQAWGMVYKAICNSSYHSEEEFEKLPPTVQRAVGNPQNLREWACMDSKTVNSVAQSHFISTYRAESKRASEKAKLLGSDRMLESKDKTLLEG